MRHLRLLMWLAWLVSGLVLAAPLRAAPGPGPSDVIATVTADTPISAGSGWVLWSAAGPGGWGLRAWHNGVVAPLPVAPRNQPFDVNVGTDAHGRAAAAYSRCVHAPSTIGLITPLTGSGCRIALLDLASGRETRPAIAHPAGTSDTTPSMSRGRIAFGRLDPAHHGKVEQVLLFSPGRRRLSTLLHGALPPSCGPNSGCTNQQPVGEIQGLDFAGGIVTFLWQPQGPRIVGNFAWEVRADLLASGRSVLLGSGFAGEVCTEGLDGVAPRPPAIDGRNVFFATLQSSCYHFTSVLTRAEPRRGREDTAPLPDQTLELTVDGPTRYALEAPKPAGETDPTCAAPGQPCQIKRLPEPTFKPSHHRPTPPFF